MTKVGLLAQDSPDLNLTEDLFYSTLLFLQHEDYKGSSWSAAVGRLITVFSVWCVSVFVSVWKLGRGHKNIWSVRFELPVASHDRWKGSIWLKCI